MIPIYSTLLPHDARYALVKAAQVKDPYERLAAIDRAAEAARQKYPHLFHKESN